VASKAAGRRASRARRKMKVKYSRHIEVRLKLREMDRDLPKQIFEEAAERYLDKETDHICRCDV
jgi:cation transport regulator ChaB